MKFIQWLHKQYKWVQTAINEPDGSKVSSKRLMSLAVIICFVVSYMKVTITTLKLVDIPTNWAGVILALILGIKALDTWKGK